MPLCGLTKATASVLGEWDYFFSLNKNKCSKVRPCLGSLSSTRVDEEEVNPETCSLSDAVQLKHGLNKKQNMLFYRFCKMVACDVQ